MTGYTAQLVEKNMTLEEWALECARAFGALIMMRDEPVGAKIPEAFKPSDYASERVKESKLTETRLSAMTQGERLAYGQKAQAERLESLRAGLAESEIKQKKLDAMANQVKAWTPPSSEHQGLKDFMLQQLDVSRQDVSYYQQAMSDAEAKTPLSFFEDALASARKDIGYYTKSHAEEIERTEQRNQWLRQLRESLQVKSED